MAKEPELISTDDAALYLASLTPDERRKSMTLEQIEMKPKDHTSYCSFCGKSDKQVVALIAGPCCFICDGCVDLCSEIVAMKREEDASRTIDQNKK